MKFYFIFVLLKWTCFCAYAAKKEALPLADGTMIRLTEAEDESGKSFQLLHTLKTGEEERVWTYFADKLGKSKFDGCVLLAGDGSAEDLVILLQMDHGGYKVIQYNYGTKGMQDITFYAKELSDHKEKTEGQFRVAVPDQLILESPKGETLAMTVAPDGQLTFRDGSPANNFQLMVMRDGKLVYLDPKKAALADQAFDRRWDPPAPPASVGTAESAPAPPPHSMDKSKLGILWGSASLLGLVLLWHGFRKWKATK